MDLSHSIFLLLLLHLSLHPQRPLQTPLSPPHHLPLHHPPSPPLRLPPLRPHRLLPCLARQLQTSPLVLRPWPPFTTAAPPPLYLHCLPPYQNQPKPTSQFLQNHKPIFQNRPEGRLSHQSVDFSCTVEGLQLQAIFASKRHLSSLLLPLTPTWEVTWFFVLQGVCTAAEVAAKKAAAGRWQLPPAVTRPLTVVFVAFTGFWLFFPQLLRNHVDDKTIGEYSILVDFVKEKTLLPLSWYLQ
ncbi:hypothetical protein PVL29_025759 [Vitis rotundifolia]|uniref:Uncharacterized protein n=1 Tax=Vitis rotundifolia TaxID=103349 RepID=A0AA38YKS2_VITRO|nr:hypothetical protein PVL29_025759 [Vitis rotundifolia]